MAFLKTVLMTAIVAVAAGCAAKDPAPAPKADLKPAGAPAMAAKPAEAPKAPAPAAAPAPAPAPTAIDKTPIKADLSKAKFPNENTEHFGWDEGESRAFFWSNGIAEVVVKLPADGDYEITVTAGCQQADKQFAKFVLEVDGQKQGEEIALKSEDAKDYGCRLPLKAGDRKIGVRFTNDIYKEGEYDLNFFLHGLKLVRVK